MERSKVLRYAGGIGGVKMDCEKCVLNGSDAICCHASKMQEELNKIYKELPIIGRYIADYKCEWFLEKEEPEC